MVRAPEHGAEQNAASSNRNTYFPANMARISGTVVATAPQRKRADALRLQPVDEAGTRPRCRRRR